MAKKSKTNDIFAKIANKTGGEVISQDTGVKSFIDSGSLAVNFICSGKFLGGGLACARVTEFYGPPSSSKSLFGTNILRGTQKQNGYAVLLDCENAMNVDFMKKSSYIDVDRLLRYTPRTLEESFNLMYNLIREIRTEDTENPIVFVYDSITVSPCEREFKETDLPQEYNQTIFKKVVGRNEQPAERAKLLSKEFRKLTPLLEKNNTTLFVINQTREKIGVMFGSPETTPGGNALSFYSSCRIRTSTQKRITNEKTGKVMGINLKIQNKKNRACRPFIETEGIRLFFDYGVDPLSGLLSLLVQEERIVEAGKGAYKVADSFLPESKTEYKFKASKERNDVPMELLLECPGIVDATNREQVEEYFADFKEAMKASNNVDFVEHAVKSEEDDIDAITQFNQEEGE